jgi:hypothetical protein
MGGTYRFMTPGACPSPAGATEIVPVAEEHG